MTFYEQINLFLESKWPRKPLGLVHAVRVSKTYGRQVFYIIVKVWNESHIIWEPFQTPIFQLYKALHGIFQKHIENPNGKHKIH